MSGIVYPSLVILHDREHGNIEFLRQNLGLEAPFHVHSATDLIEAENSCNDGLLDAASRAKILLVQERLTRPLTETAFDTVRAALFSSIRIVQVGIFNDDYQVTKLSAGQALALPRTSRDEELQNG